MINEINLENSKLLIVDDSQENIKLLGSYFSKKYKIAIAYDGQQAIEIAKDFQPDITLMDINMPNMNGIEATEKILSNDDIKKHPIIFTTALDDIETTVNGFEAGGVDYVIKPFELKNLEKRLENHLQISKMIDLLKQKNNELDELNRTKDKFFSIIAHNLKSPFAGLMNLTDLFIEEFDRIPTDQIRKSLIDMGKSLKGVYKLMENLLDWARLQKGQVDYNPASLNIKEVIEDIIFILSNSAKKKKITVSFNYDGELIGFTDYHVFHTIFRNLLSNAIKFTYENGTIKVFIEDLGSDLKISIKDDGMGIKDEIKEKLFKIDTHNTSLGTNKEKGTGLGLILVKEFVDLQNGTISFESEIGKGTTFSFTVPKE